MRITDLIRSYTCPMTLGVCRDDQLPVKNQYVQLEQELGFRSKNNSRDASRGGLIIPSGEMLDPAQICRVQHPAEDDLASFYAHWNKRARRERSPPPSDLGVGEPLPLEVTDELDFACLEEYAAQLEYDPLTEFPQLDPLAGDYLDAIDRRFVVPELDARELLETGLGIALDLLAYPPRCVEDGRADLITCVYREDTFAPVEKLFPAHRNTLAHQVSVRHLAQAGFYYSAESKAKFKSKSEAERPPPQLETVCLRCFYCRLQLTNWRESDDPWVAHAFWSPGCPYLLRVRGHSFAHRVHFDFLFASSPPTSAANPFGSAFNFEQHKNNRKLLALSERVVQRFGNAYGAQVAPITVISAQ